jgi:hypothetical protein
MESSDMGDVVTDVVAYEQRLPLSPTIRLVVPLSTTTAVVVRLS